MINLQAYIERNNQRKALKAAATPGHWVACVGSGHNLCTGVSADPVDDSNEQQFVCDVLPDYVEKDDKAWEYRSGNLRFITSAKNDELEQDVDALIAEVTRLREYERQVNNFLTFGQGGANFTDSQWVDKLATAEHQRDMLQDEVNDLRGIIKALM